MFKTVTTGNVKTSFKGIFSNVKSLFKKILNWKNTLVKDFKSITWPDKATIKKEFIIVLLASIVITFCLFLISSGTTFILKLIF